MKTWLANRWDWLHTTFWFVPSLMLFGAVVLSNLMLALDHALGVSNWFAAMSWTVARGPEGSRQLLGAVAGSMITIASLTFSITIVALQLASSQFGPRLLRNFMRDRGNQFTLGTFIATYTYCLLVLRAVNGQEDQIFVPHLSVTVGLLLSLASLGVLIYFIHHAAESIQADYVIETVAQEMHEAIGWLFPEKLGQGPPGPHGFIYGSLPEDFDTFARPIAAPTSGYVQGIDDGRLMSLARDHDLVLRVMARPGLFLIQGAPLAHAWPADRVDDATLDSIRGAFYLGMRRTTTQDVEFAIDQLVEVAVRALSPGINDPFTAVACVERLGEALVALGQREFPSERRYDAEGRLRVVAKPFTKHGVVDAALHQVRQAARTSVAVTLRLFETITTVAGLVDDPEFRDALRRHAVLIDRGAQDALPEESDRLEARERFARCLEALGPVDPPDQPEPVSLAPR